MIVVAIFVSVFVIVAFVFLVVVVDLDVYILVEDLSQLRKYLLEMGFVWWMMKQCWW